MMEDESILGARCRREDMVLMILLRVSETRESQSSSGLRPRLVDVVGLRADGESEVVASEA